MSHLRIYADDNPADATTSSNDHDEIADHLSAVGVRFEKWLAEAPVVAGDSQDEIIAEYRSDIDRLIETDGYQTVDVVSLTADHPDKDKLRQTFLSEHAHSEDEVRFFVDGQGLFSLHIGDSVYEVLCQKGDLISVPANTPHWFDMGPNPNFVAIRLFNNPDGWVANYSGSKIAEQFSRLEN
jgi:1,2-dihydroxy-3-keto-5-methylthiopentene dioxygenase